VASHATTPQKHAKRHIDDYFAGDESDFKDDFTLDQDRFEGRGAFVPFVDM
jgi:hypothetical protein